MYPIHEYGRPGDVIEQRLLVRDVPTYLGSHDKQANREALHSSGWQGPFVLRVDGTNARMYRRYLRVVSA
jgi:hypothetical protein